MTAADQLGGDVGAARRAAPDPAALLLGARKLAGDALAAHHAGQLLPSRRAAPPAGNARLRARLIAFRRLDAGERHEGSRHPETIAGHGLRTALELGPARECDGCD